MLPEAKDRTEALEFRDRLDWKAILAFRGVPLRPYQQQLIVDAGHQIFMAIADEKGLVSCHAKLREDGINGAATTPSGVFAARRCSDVLDGALGSFRHIVLE